MSPEIKKQFYDLEVIRQIPILEVCERFGVHVEKVGTSHKCKLRPERTASTVLHPDKNIYHDFGTSETGNNIGLVSTFCGVDRGEAIRLLADAFNISPVNPRGGLTDAELTKWEYSKIGLDGAKATRNFDFDIERQGIKRVSELSLLYAMPMNVLKKNHPYIYEKLLRNKAIPYVKKLRVSYFMDVYSTYVLAMEIGSDKAFRAAVENGEFAETIKELQSAERILERACKDTRIEAWPVGEYDPVKDLDTILNGEPKLALGSVSKVDLTKIAEKEHTTAKYQSVDIRAFILGQINLNDITHSASIKRGTVVIGYLEKDQAVVKPLLQPFRTSFRKTLDQTIHSAKQNAEDATRKGSKTRGPDAIGGGR